MTENTSRTPHLGVAFVPTLPPERLRAVAQAAEAAGLDELWVWEDCFKESGIATAAVALASTERIRVGLGLMPAPLRNVALTAMEIATLDRIFSGRFTPGVGHGVQFWMSQAGARVASPMTLLREYAVALRRLLAGEEVTVEGRYVSLDKVRLDWPPAERPALLLGGAGPKSLALAGELGDGTLLSSALTDEQIRQASEIALRSHTQSGSGPEHEVVATLIAATGPGARERVEAEALKWSAEPGQPVGVGGDARVIAEAIRRLARFGVTSVSIQPTEDEPDLEGFIHFLGYEVRALL